MVSFMYNLHLMRSNFLDLLLLQLKYDRESSSCKTKISFASRRMPISGFRMSCLANCRAHWECRSSRSRKQQHLNMSFPYSINCRPSLFDTLLFSFDFYVDEKTLVSPCPFQFSLSPSESNFANTRFRLRATDRYDGGGPASSLRACWIIYLLRHSVSEEAVNQTASIQ